MVYLSIIIPAFNEGRRISRTLLSVHEFMRSKRYDYEVIIVDDGSTDDTVLQAEQSLLSKDHKLQVINNGSNMGKGFSVKNGILHSSGQYVLFMDADLSTPIGEVDKLLNEIGAGNDIVLGSRSIGGANVVTHQPWYREVMGKTFNLFVRLLIISEFKDTQCGFKLFKGEVAREIAGLMRINGFAFDVEMLYIAKIKKYKMKETGVSWKNSTESKVRLLRSPVSMFLDLFKIKMIHASTK